MILDIETREGINFAPSWLPLLHSAANAAERAEGVGIKTAVHLLITDDQEIRTINKEYREIDRSTDVLSFPTINYPASEHAGTVPALLEQEYDPDEAAACLGDIIISMDHVRSQAHEYGHSLERELCYLLVHGLFHLFGYDHMNESD